MIFFSTQLIIQWIVWIVVLSRSWSQWTFNISVNVWVDDVFWTAEVLKPNLVWWYIIISWNVMQEFKFGLIESKYNCVISSEHSLHGKLILEYIYDMCV